ncbi:hypothetical protein [Flavobacterium sp.]
MPAKKSIAFGNLLALWLLVSYTAVAKPLAYKNEFLEKRGYLLTKAAHSFHQHMLQCQLAHFGMFTQDTSKIKGSGYFALLFEQHISRIPKPIGQANQISQDTNRCETVSSLLFPYHIFW